MIIWSSRKFICFILFVCFFNSLMNWKFKRTAFIWNIYFCNHINVFTGTFGRFNAHLLNKIYISKKKSYWPTFLKNILQFGTAFNMMIAIDVLMICYINGTEGKNIYNFNYQENNQRKRFFGIFYTVEWIPIYSFFPHGSLWTVTTGKIHDIIAQEKDKVLWT